MLTFADLFCGAGGTSLGAEMSGGARASFAVNHWDVAIQTHVANFPHAKHVQTELRWVKPSESPPINLLFASPECTHHSRARGGRPTTDQQRAGAWELMPWIEHHRPQFVVIENVVEFKEWGPVSDRGIPLQSYRGRFFEAWVAAIESAGYRVEFHQLNAADFGACTNRNRLFVIARKGRRAINWPDPTHSNNAGGELPGMELTKWRGAIEIIDWSLPLPSVFGRPRPLADKTLARIEAGLRRHVEPFVVHLRNNMVGAPTDQPVRVITTGSHHGLLVPFVATVNHGDDGKSGERTKPIGDPLGVVTTSNGRAVIAPYFIPYHGEAEGQRTRSHAGSSPLPTVACSKTAALAAPLVMAPQSSGVAKHSGEPVPVITTGAGSQLIVPWLTSFYGTMNTSRTAQPVPTVTTVDRHALSAAMLSEPVHAAPVTDAERSLARVMKELGVADVGFRMLANEELAKAQGFTDEYVFHGTKKDVTRQIGNSVSPPVAKAIVESIAA